MPATLRLPLLALAAAVVAGPAFAQRDGAPGNPPSTAAQRALDGALANPPTPPDGTPGNPPGTAVGRAIDRALGGEAGRDATRGDPPGTALERGYDRATGSNTSGAYPSNESPAPRR